MATMGISTNTRLLGLAILSEDGLADYFIRHYKSSWSPEKATLMVSSLEPRVRKYSIEEVVLSIPPRHHQTKELQLLHTALRIYFEAQKIALYPQDSDALYLFCRNQNTKQGIIESLAQHFPELQQYHHKEARNKHAYYTKLFEAAGVALLHRKRQ